MGEFPVGHTDGDDTDRGVWADRRQLEEGPPRAAAFPAGEGTAVWTESLGSTLSHAVAGLPADVLGASMRVLVPDPAPSSTADRIRCGARQDCNGDPRSALERPSFIAMICSDCGDFPGVVDNA